MRKRILVMGTSRPFQDEARLRAYLLGQALARHGFDLVTGNWSGVDARVSEGFHAGPMRSDDSTGARFTQLRNPSLRRFFYSVGRSYRAKPSEIEYQPDGIRSIDWAVAKCDAAVMIGGGRGALRVARRFMSAGKPVFPLPFTGGNSDVIFQELLKSWHDNPIPGLTREQVLRLALPWSRGADSLTELLRGTLADEHDIFISYRRADSASAVGRLHSSLTEQFGTRRVFVDTNIEPSTTWGDQIKSAIESSKVGLVVIGRHWLDGRLMRQDDIVRQEVSSLLASKVTSVIPILVDDAGMPDVHSLPPDLHPLLAKQALPINNATWSVVLPALTATIKRILFKTDETSSTAADSDRFPFDAWAAEKRSDGWYSGHSSQGSSGPHDTLEAACAEIGRRAAVELAARYEKLREIRKALDNTLPKD